MVKHKNVHFDKNENSTEPLKLNKLVLTSAYKQKAHLASRTVHQLPKLALGRALSSAFCSC